MMGDNRQNKVLLVYLPKKFPLRLGKIWAQFGPNLYNLMSHDLLSEDLFEVSWHYEIQKIDKVSLSYFSKNLLLEQYEPNLAQNYTILHHIKCPRDFLSTFQKHSSMMWCNSYYWCNSYWTLFIFANFPNKFLFQTSCNSGKNGAISLS